MSFLEAASTLTHPPASVHIGLCLSYTLCHLSFGLAASTEWLAGAEGCGRSILLSSLSLHLMASLCVLAFHMGTILWGQIARKVPFPVKIFAILKFCSIVFILFNSGFRVLINNAFHHVKCSHMQPKEWNQSRMQVRLKWCYWVEISKGKGRRMVPVHDWLH